MKGKILNMDCMDLMRETPDKFYDLAIVDPPYGIKKHLAHAGNGKNSLSVFANKVAWDVAPSNEYFAELLRVSKNLIIFGANHFDHKIKSRCFIIWDKKNYLPSMSRIEYAITTFNKLPVFLEISSRSKTRRIHPTQKPVVLYNELLRQFAKPGDKILDTHGGSMSLAIACENIGFDYTITEINKDYYNDGLKRLNTFLSAPKLFDANEIGLISI